MGFRLTRDAMNRIARLLRFQRLVFKLPLLCKLQMDGFMVQKINCRATDTIEDFRRMATFMI